MRRLSALFGIALFLFTAACAFDDSAKKQASYHFQMGLSYLGENDPTRALIELTEAEKLTPDDPNLLNSLGLAYYYKKRFDLAEKAYLRAIELNPAYSEARNNLGVDYMDMQRWDDAITQFKVVLADLFFLHHEDARINLGLAYLGKGDYAQSLGVLRQAVEASPQNVIARVALGRVYFAMDKTDQAISEYQKAVAIAENYQNAHYYLALAYLKKKDYIAAANSFKAAIKLAPDSEKGRLSREYLESMK